MPATLPGLRHADRPRRGRGPPLLPEPGVPGARRPGVRPLRRRRWTSRAPAGRCSSSCSRRGLVKRRGDFFRLTVEDLEGARPVRPEERREPARGDPEGAPPAARADHRRARASRRSAGRRRSSSPTGWPAEVPAGRRAGSSGRRRTSARSRPTQPGAVRRRSRASARRSPAALAAWFGPAGRARASSRTWPTPASRPSCPRRAAARGGRARWPARRSSSPARSRASAARRPRRRSARPAASRRLGVEEDRLRRRRPRRRLEAGEGRGAGRPGPRRRWLPGCSPASRRSKVRP